MPKSQTVRVEQMHNPYKGGRVDRTPLNGTEKPNEIDSDVYVYHVVQLKNILKPAIGEYVRAAVLDGLIESGVEVTITPVK